MVLSGIFLICLGVNCWGWAYMQWLSNRQMLRLTLMPVLIVAGAVGVLAGVLQCLHN